MRGESKRPVDLPEDVDALRDLVLSMHEKIELLDDELRIVREQVRLLKHLRYGRSSEKMEDVQQWLFNEAEAALDETPEPEPEAEEPSTEIAAHKRRKPGRKPIPDDVPRVEVVHDLPDVEKVCAKDGSALERIGKEVSEQLEFIPAKLRAIRHVRPKYACPTCREGIRTAPLPPQPIPKSLASPTLLAYVAVSKYADSLPLYRQEEMFRRLGIELPRASLANWMVKAGELLQSLVNLLRDDLLASGFVQCDETRYQVLKEPGKAATSQSYVWTQCAPDEDIVLFDYDPSRSQEVPKALLAGFQGHLQTDGYPGYDAIGQEPGVIHVGCWAHARRKFDDALKAQTKSAKKNRSLRTSKALQGLRYIQKLYKIERAIREKPPDERLRIRQERSLPIVEKLRTWLDTSLGQVPPQTLTGKALAYLDGQWPKLVRVFEDGRLPLDTNRVENAIRPFVVGRKNWLFSDTVRGAQASANLYSLIQTARASGVEPFAYLRLVFEQLPSAESLDELERLLPRRVDPDALQDARRFSAIS